MVGLPVSFLVHPARLRLLPSNSGIPEAALGAMEDIHAGVDQGPQELLQLGRSFRQLRIIVADLPLRDAQRDRELRTDPPPDFADGLRGETRACDQIPAVAVGALVGFLPEELVDQVSVRSVQLDAVEAGFLRRSSRLRVRLDGGIDVALSHREFARRTHGMPAFRRRRPARDLQADVPDLRKNVSARGVHLIDHAAPAVQRGFAVEVRHLGIEPAAGCGG